MPQETQEQDHDEEFKIEESVEIVVNSNGSETEIHRQELVPVDKKDESDSDDPAAGTGLPKKSDSTPTTTTRTKPCERKDSSTNARRPVPRT